MSISRWRDNSMQINLNPDFIFRFMGSQATSSTVGRINNVWNLATLRKNKIDTVEGIELDQYDRYPESEAQVAVWVDGVFQESDVDFSYTAKSSSADPTVTFLKDIDDNSRVTFML